MMNLQVFDYQTIVNKNHYFYHLSISLGNKKRPFKSSFERAFHFVFMKNYSHPCLRRVSMLY